ncbi:hypothetical protein AJ80_10076 [Polytolypa hystricis UAMH7299]|uniref:Phytanoyl-CoA dioxygenase n=1 Tax=Polytolypa hystricis (strain UAMH7299) TaxID=1447883 RepID=A0A2B7WED3_POLH7|nr:hypothetical protein AJ80_10076 [Polytolypa hystricis UAMH7299]
MSAPAEVIAPLPGDAVTTTDPNDNNIAVVRISDEELQSGHASTATVGAALGAFHRDGIVVLENAVPLSDIHSLNTTLQADIPALIANPNTNWNGGREVGNISQPPPMTPDLMYPSIWANPFAASVLSALIGPHPQVIYVNGNTALGHSSKRQDVHADLVFPFATTHPFGIVANYYLTDASVDNGVTEVWLRSQRASNFDMHQPSHAYIREEHLQSRAANSGFPPIRPTVRAGSVVLRDLRLWHAGHPNTSDTPRIMLAFVHVPWWYETKLTIALPRSAESLTQSWANRERPHERISYPVTWIDGDVDHTNVKFQGNFQSGNKAYLATVPKGENVSFFEKAGADNVSGSSIQKFHEEKDKEGVAGQS